MAFDSKGDLWIVDSSNNRVLEYAPPFSTGEAASQVIGQTSLTGSGDTSSSGSLFGPTGLAFDPSGDLWVVDTGNNRILEFKTPFSDGESASLVIGQPTFGGYIGTTSSGGLNSPSYIAFDPSGNLWVTDQGNNRVLEFASPFSTGEKASVVIGHANFTSFAPSSTVTAKSMFEPVGIAFDSKGDLWVADSGDDRVLEYAAPFSIGDSAAIAVIGQSSLTGTSTGLHAYAIAFDSGDDLWVSDGISGVAEYQGPVTTGEAGIQEVGPTTVTTASTSPGDKLRDPQGIAFDGNDNLWVADYDHGRVVVYGSTVIRTTSSIATSSSCSSTKASGALGGGLYNNGSASSSTTASGAQGGGIYNNGTASTTATGGSGGGIYNNGSDLSYTTTSSCSTTATSGTSGGVPAFPYQPAIAAVFTVLLVSSYLSVRHRRPWKHGREPTSPSG